MNREGLRADRVSMDGIGGLADAGGPSFPCFVSDDLADRWNGWGRPYFDAANAAAIVAYVNQAAAEDPDAWSMRIDRDGDAYVVRNLEAGPEYDDRIEPVEIDGRPYWQIGNGWCWFVAGDSER